MTKMKRRASFVVKSLSFESLKMFCILLFVGNSWMNFYPFFIVECDFQFHVHIYIVLITVFMLIYNQFIFCSSSESAGFLSVMPLIDERSVMDWIPVGSDNVFCVKCDKFKIKLGHICNIYVPSRWLVFIYQLDVICIPMSEWQYNPKCHMYQRGVICSLWVHASILRGFWNWLMFIYFLGTLTNEYIYRCRE